MTDNDINDILKDQERVLIAAWMLPNEGDLTDAQRRQAMNNFKNYLAEANVNARQVAKQLGSPQTTTIRELIQGTFREGSDVHIRKLNMWIEQDARRRAASLEGKFIDTRVARSMKTIAKLCRENQTMAMALGPTGIGKSRCAQAIYESYVGAILIRITVAHRSTMGLTHALATQLGVLRKAVNTNGQSQFMFERVVEALKSSNRLLIIDEAHRLSDDAMELLRDIHDVAGVPVLMIATKDLHDRIVANADADHGQLYSRFDVIHHLTQGFDPSMGTHPKVLFTVDDVKALYNEPEVRLASDAVGYLQDVANHLGFGSLRRCERLLINAVRRARKRLELGADDKVTVTADDLDWVERQLRRVASEVELLTTRRRTMAAAASG